MLEMLGEIRDVVGTDKHFVNVGMGFEIIGDFVEIFCNVASADVVIGVKKGFKNFITKIVNDVINIVIMKIESPTSDVGSLAELGDTNAVNVVLLFDEFGKSLADEAASFDG